MNKTYKGATDTDRVLVTEKSHHVDGGIYLNVRIRPGTAITDGAAIHLSRATFQEFVKDAQAWLDDTEVKTPTKRAAVIRATMHNGSKEGKTRLLSLSDYGDSMPWKDEEDGAWYTPDEFTTTEVLFLGVDA